MMNRKMLEKKYHINNETGFLCRYVRSETERFKPHYHDYYEVFLMLDGNAEHIIGDTKQIISSGDMIFIRNFDFHDYIKHTSDGFEFINLAFDKKYFDEMCRYLSDTFNPSGLIKAELPPMVKLTKNEKEKIFFAMSELINTEDTANVRLKFKKLILDMFTSYFLNYTPQKSEIPLWLEITYEKMKKPKNFIVGISRMNELSGVSKEHLSRCMKKYYGITPTAFINDLRLTHSGNLLISSNLNVTDICFECGFNNIAWFYKAFEAKYGISPMRYRKEHANYVTFSD